MGPGAPRETPAEPKYLRLIPGISGGAQVSPEVPGYPQVFLGVELVDPKELVLTATHALTTRPDTMHHKGAWPI